MRMGPQQADAWTLNLTLFQEGAMSPVLLHGHPGTVLAFLSAGKFLTKTNKTDKTRTCFLPNYREHVITMNDDEKIAEITGFFHVIHTTGNEETQLFLCCLFL